MECDGVPVTLLSSVLYTVVGLVRTSCASLLRMVATLGESCPPYERGMRWLFRRSIDAYVQLTRVMESPLGRALTRVHEDCVADVAPDSKMGKDCGVIRARWKEWMDMEAVAYVEREESV